ncbi:hypothetical protein BH11PSE9_BH11PSE9_18730 [soil metagenome]
MNKQIRRIGTAVSSAALLFAAGCGGDDSSTPAPVAPTTTDVSTTVIDGAIKNALVCLDKNSNGLCDTGEVQGRTDATGKVTLAVPNADVGKYPIVASVGTDATDADHGAVTTAYTMSTPADQTGVVSPLTTLVQQTIATTGATAADAAKSVQDATGITASLFQDFTKAAAPTDGSTSAATVARMLVVTTQQQTTALASALGTAASDGTTITQANLDKAIQKKLLELLPALVTALSDPALVAATDKETALLAAAQTLVTESGLTSAGIATVVAIDNQTSTTTPVTTRTAAAGFSLRLLSFTDPANYNLRFFTSSLAQDTADASGNVKYVDRRVRSTGGNLARWGNGSDPSRNADLHWNGKAWANCPINFENTSSVRDAQGNSVYNYCDSLETGRSNRATFDVSGKTMASVYAQVRAAGYTSLSIADPSLLGTATFPAGSSLLYISSTPLTEAFAYYPGGSDPVGTSDVVAQYSAAVAAGGVASAQAAGVGCNAAETNGNGSNTATLEAMIALASGTPCTYAQASFSYGGTTYTSDVPNEWWGNSTVSIGTIGSVALNTGTAPGFYSGNTKLRIAFNGTGTNPVTYLACKERFTNGSNRNCTAIGTGSYAITTLGDARVLTLINPPLQAAPLNYNRVFVERGGLIYLGYQSKPIVNSNARLNTIGATALLAQLGLPPEDPSVPYELTAGSYQGTWDVKDATAATTANGTTIYINGNGNVFCQDRSDASFFACTLSFTDAATGAFSLTATDSGGVASGHFDFLAGTGSGSFADGNFVARRR